MTAPTSKPLVDEFVRNLTARLTTEMLDGDVRMDNTHTVVIVPVKGRGPIHAGVQGVDAAAVENVLGQIKSVPSLKGLVRES